MFCFAFSSLICLFSYPTSHLSKLPISFVMIQQYLIFFLAYAVSENAAVLGSAVLWRMSCTVSVLA